MRIRLKEAKSQYSNDNIIDPLTYKVNCSGFVNHVLEAQCFNAMREIQDHIKLTNDYRGYKNGSLRCLQYYKFFESKAPKQFWKTITNVKHLIPGDIIVYCENIEKVTKHGQHIMIVADRIQGSNEQDCFICPVFDSTGNHGPLDLRGSGIGEGQISLKINHDGKPEALKWHPDSEHFLVRKIAMARVQSLDI